MDDNTRKRIEQTIQKAATLTEQGADEYDAARQVLSVQTSAVLLELATAAVVDSVRRRQRGDVLQLERGATRKARDRRKVDPEWAAISAEIDEQHAQRLSSNLRSILDAYTEEMRLEWTAELLGSEFALRDGTRVTWGEATVEQHSERVALFMDNAHANMEGAARHQKAIEALQSAKAPTLAALVGVAA